MIMKPYFSSSLNVVLKDGPINNNNILPKYVVKDDKINLQIIIPSFKKESKNIEIKYSVNEEIKSFSSLYIVEFVRPKKLINEQLDGDHIYTLDNLFPDRLKNINLQGILKINQSRWTSLWLTIDTSKMILNEKLEIAFTISSKSVNESIKLLLDVIDERLPVQITNHTEWLHTDSLCQYYNIEPFSDEYWFVVENYIRLGYEHSQDTVLTPIFTPALDTEENHERQTIQLIQVEKVNGRYLFDFSNLTKWSNMLKRVGIKNIEFPPLFTQWGAKFTPKIIVQEDGKNVKEFGWHEKFNSKKYRFFLENLLPELNVWIRDNGWTNKTFIHISDEPNDDSKINYKYGKELVMDNLENVSYIDALSEIVFYNEKLVDIPVVGTPSIESFILEDINNLWCYYCGIHNHKVSNRFINQFPRRTQILGLQMYKFNIKGFLHWGYNFWFTELSRKFIDSFDVFGGGDELPAGDAFVVYPGEEYTAEPSIRLKSMLEAFQDIRLCELLEQYIGREGVLSIINDYFPNLTFETVGENLENLTKIRNKLKTIIINEKMKIE